MLSVYFIVFKVFSIFFFKNIECPSSAWNGELFFASALSYSEWRLNWAPKNMVSLKIHQCCATSIIKVAIKMYSTDEPLQWIGRKMRCERARKRWTRVWKIHINHVNSLQSVRAHGFTYNKKIYIETTLSLFRDQNESSLPRPIFLRNPP